MTSQRTLLWAATIIVCAGAWAQEATMAGPMIVTVAQDGSGDFNGDDQQPIIAAVAVVGERGGGRIVIGPGDYIIRQTINLTGKSDITISGEGGAVLNLPPPALVTEAAAKGQSVLTVDDASSFIAQTGPRLEPPPEQKTFEGTDLRSMKVQIASVEAGRVELAAPLDREVPAGSSLSYACNVLTAYSNTTNITIEGLTIDGGRRPDTHAQGHCNRCAILAHGQFKYETGPTAPPIENLQVLDCTIRNCWGRAVAMYSVVNSLVSGCVIDNIGDEGINLDHFCYHCHVIGNEATDAVTGVTINDGSYCVVADNRLTNCGTGVTIWWWHLCPEEGLDIHNRIVGNTITNPAGAGIAFGDHTAYNLALGNTITGAGRVGIWLAGAHNRAVRNTVRDCGEEGIIVRGEGNEAADNDVTGATPDE